MRNLTQLKSRNKKALVLSKERLKQLDYDYSYKLATLFEMDSKIRKFFLVITQTGTFIMWGIAFLITYFSLPEERSKIVSLIFITGIMLIPVFIIKQTVKRNRPSYKDTRFGTVAFDKYSFPSGHATRASYAMIIMPIFTPTLTIFWIIWGLTMISSRLILGVHYISDIITGILLGAICMLILIWMGWVPVIPFIAALF